MAQHIIADLTSRYGAGRLSTADSVVLLTPHLALDEGEYTYEPGKSGASRFMQEAPRQSQQRRAKFSDSYGLKVSGKEILPRSSGAHKLD